MAAMAPFVDNVDVAAVLRYFLTQFGIDQPDELLKAPGPEPEQIVDAIGKTMQEAGFPEDVIHQVLETALKRLEEEPEPQPEEKPAAPEGAAPQPVGA